MRQSRRQRVGPYLTLAARFGLAGVWVVSALTKIGDPDAGARAVRAYDLLPELLVEPFAYALPFIELTLAVLLVTGIAPRAAAWASLPLLAVFTAGIASAWARGLQIDCGCFGGGGQADTDAAYYLTEIIRDLGFSALAVVAAVGPEPPVRLQGQMKGRLPARLRSRQGQAAVVGVAVAAAALLGVAVQVPRSVSGSGEVAVPGGGGAGEPRTVEGTPWLLGEPGAPVLVEIYEDLTCATCRRVHDEVEPGLDPFTADGTVELAIHPMPVHGDEALHAAAAAQCAHDAGAFPQYRDVVFAAQDGDVPLTDQRLVALGERVGLVEPEFAACVEEGTYLTWARERLDEGSRRGVVLTPTVFIDGELVPPPLTAGSLADEVRQGLD